jgi:transposase
MSDTKYIGMDVHAASISIAVLDEAGKLIMEATIATEASTIADFVGGLQGRLQVTFEEGIHAAWLYQMLLPSVAQVLVCDPRQLPRHKSERKSDRIDARQLAEWLRLGALKAVYHEGSGSGRQAPGESVRSYLTLVSDTTRVMNRLKAIYRGRGIPARGTRVYAPAYRQVWLDQLREPGVRHRTELLYRQLDSLLPLRHEAKKSMIAEGRKQAAAQKVLLSIPTLGPVRVAILMAVLQTPYRFRTKRKLWSYAGLGVVTRSSADYQLRRGQLTRSRQPALILGLNRNHNPVLKAIFKAAAATAAARPGALQEFYARCLEQGMDPEIARVTTARKLATLVLTLWKKGERFHAEHLKPQAA